MEKIMGLQMGVGTVQLELSCIFGLGWISVLGLLDTGCVFWKQMY